MSWTFTPEMSGAAVSGGASNSILSKLVNQLLEEPIVALGHACAHPVAIVRACPAGTATCTVAWVGQLTVTVLVVSPPLYASSRRMRIGLTNVIPALVVQELANAMLLVVSPPHGAECHQAPVPQSITPAGNWPSNGCSSPGRSSKVRT